MNKTNRLYCLALMVFTALSVASVNADDGYGSLGFGKKIAGLYFLAQDSGSFRTLTITADGRMLGVDSSQEGSVLVIAIPFSDQQGVWKKVDNRHVQAKMVDFLFSNQVEDAPFASGGTTIATYDIFFDDDYNAIDGSISLVFYPPHVNPFDTDVEPTDPIVITFTGERVTP